MENGTNDQKLLSLAGRPAHLDAGHSAHPSHGTAQEKQRLPPRRKAWRKHPPASWHKIPERLLQIAAMAVGN